MCTALSLKAKHCYFGRNLDVNNEYNESIVIAPRNYTFAFKHLEPVSLHTAIIGMAVVINGTPLFFDGCNEAGLAIAGLNFPRSCKYNAVQEGKKNILSSEMISYILANAMSVNEAIALLDNANITNEGFIDGMPTSPLHWIISDEKKSIVVEQTKKGLNIYDNPIDVLTNEPEFPIHMFNLNNYRNITKRNPKESIFPTGENYCLGLGTIGLPGDYSSPSRFVKTAYLKNCTAQDLDPDKAVVQFFHILDAVSFQKGSVEDDNGIDEVTYYSACMDLNSQSYYYKTYDNPNIAMVGMKNIDLDTNLLLNFPLLRNFEPIKQN